MKFFREVLSTNIETRKRAITCIVLRHWLSASTVPSTVRSTATSFRIAQTIRQLPPTLVTSATSGLEYFLEASNGMDLPLLDTLPRAATRGLTIGLDIGGRA